MLSRMLLPLFFMFYCSFGYGQVSVSSFDPDTSIVNLPIVDVSSTRYTSVQVKLLDFSVVGVGVTTVTQMSAPSYDTTMSLLNLPIVSVGSTSYIGVVVKIASMSLISVGENSSSRSYTLSSNSFTDGGQIPTKHACTAKGGSNLSPAISWENAPSGSVTFAVIMDDETTPCGTGDSACIHWNVINIPSSTNDVAEGMDPLTLASSVALGTAYNGAVGYQGPCPPFRHTYKTTIFALNAIIPTSSSTYSGMTRSQFSELYANYILGTSTLTGIFGN